MLPVIEKKAEIDVWPGLEILVQSESDATPRVLTRSCVYFIAERLRAVVVHDEDAMAQ
jgi:hypothetical protein